MYFLKNEKFFTRFFFLFLVFGCDDIDKAAASSAHIDKVEAKDYLNYLSGRITPEKDDRFVKVPLKYSLYSNMYMRKDFMQAFQKMATAAKKDGFDIYILSGTRNFATQKIIWENKFNGRQLVNGKKLNETVKDFTERALVILRYSSMPGTSRHHWGTDFDIAFRKTSVGMLQNDTYEKGEGLKFYNWMLLNAKLYGFCQPYTGNPQNRRKLAGQKSSDYDFGYQEEKWHWSYFPIAAKLTQDYLRNKDLLKPSGFDGAAAAAQLHQQFVGNIDLSCQ